MEWRFTFNSPIEMIRVVKLEELSQYLDTLLKIDEVINDFKNGLI